MKHTILVLSANPSGTEHLALEQEERSIRTELERSRYRDCFELAPRGAAEPTDLLRELRALQPTVVHFSGHGRGGTTRAAQGRAVCRDIVAPPGGTGEREGLLFQHADGTARVVSAAALRDAFSAAGASVRLVVLNACYSEPAADALLAGVDCVVGMAGTIRDDSATSFAIGFYGGLGGGASVEAAYKTGCAAISLEGLPDRDRPRLRARPGVDPGALVLGDGTRAHEPAPSRSRQDLADMSLIDLLLLAKELLTRAASLASSGPRDVMVTTSFGVASVSRSIAIDPSARQDLQQHVTMAEIYKSSIEQLEVQMQTPWGGHPGYARELEKNRRALEDRHRLLLSALRRFLV